MPSGRPALRDAPAAPAPVLPRPGRSQTRRRIDRLGLLLVAPAAAVIAVLVLYPSLSSVVGSFQRYELTDPNRAFTGLRNYTSVLGDSTFVQSLLNTGAYFLVLTACVLVMGLVMALWLQSIRGRARAVALTVIVLPWSVPGTVAGVLWSFILNPTGTGLLNSVLKTLNLIGSYQAWLNKPVAGLVVVALTVAWSAVPLGVIILLAGLEGIPREIYEQSLVDGANRLKQFVSITLPLLRPAIAIVLLNGAVLAIGLFDQVYVLVGLDPSRITIAGQMYLYAFRDFNFGFGFAASVIATAITAAISLVYLKLVYREEEY
ncbi:MAG: multiple sugar transport system permease protein [Microbacteriaceae bacterium]|nr:multiple sugar transport system permease protein [Microbacteriaceae bacterium]